MRKLGLPIVVIVSIFSCCRWSCCGCSWWDWFEQYRRRHTAIFFSLPSYPCPATHSATHIMSCIVCAGVSRKGGKEPNSFNTICIYNTYIFPCIVLSLCFCPLCIVTLYLQCINSFYYYLSLLLLSFSSSYSHYVFLMNLWIQICCALLCFPCSPFIGRPIATMFLYFCMRVCVCVYSMRLYNFRSTARGRSLNQGRRIEFPF